MGHNWVLSKSSDVTAIASEGIPASLDNDYLKPKDSRVLAATKMIGGGEKASVTFDVNLLKDKEKYSFFCSFPGHSGIMIGSVTVK